jgi:hypothetical protein
LVVCNFYRSISSVIVVHLNEDTNGWSCDHCDNDQRNYGPEYFQKYILTKGGGNRPLLFAVTNYAINNDTIDNRHNADNNPHDHHVQVVDAVAGWRYDF